MQGSDQGVALDVLHQRCDEFLTTEITSFDTINSAIQGMRVVINLAENAKVSSDQLLIIKRVLAEFEGIQAIRADYERARDALLAAGQPTAVEATINGRQKIVLAPEGLAILYNPDQPYMQNFAYHVAMATMHSATADAEITALEKRHPEIAAALQWHQQQSNGLPLTSQTTQPIQRLMRQKLIAADLDRDLKTSSRTPKQERDTAQTVFTPTAKALEQVVKYVNASQPAHNESKAIQLKTDVDPVRCAEFQLEIAQRSFALSAEGVYQRTLGEIVELQVAELMDLKPFQLMLTPLKQATAYLSASKATYRGYIQQLEESDLQEDQAKLIQDYRDYIGVLDSYQTQVQDKAHLIITNAIQRAQQIASKQSKDWGGSKQQLAAIDQCLQLALSAAQSAGFENAERYHIEARISKQADTLLFDTDKKGPQPKGQGMFGTSIDLTGWVGLREQVARREQATEQSYRTMVSKLGDGRRENYPQARAECDQAKASYVEVFEQYNKFYAEYKAIEAKLDDYKTRGVEIPTEVQQEFDSALSQAHEVHSQLQLAKQHSQMVQGCEAREQEEEEGPASRLGPGVGGGSG